MSTYGVSSGSDVAAKCSILGRNDPPKQYEKFSGFAESLAKPVYNPLEVPYNQFGIVP
jgi:hypothetical protein